MNVQLLNWTNNELALSPHPPIPSLHFSEAKKLVVEREGGSSRN